MREVSPERAAAIEAASWQTTKRLVEAFEEETLADGASFTEKTEEKTALPLAEPQKEGLAASLGELCALVRLCEKGDVAGARAFAKERGRMLDALIDEINSVAADVLGDIILEDTGAGFAVIEDYREQLASEGVL